MAFNIREWDFRRCKGTVATYVARGTGKPETISKSIATTVRKGHLARADIDQMLAEIERDTEVFVQAQWSDPAGRVQRLGTIKVALSQ
jgi:hypothetical protein